MRSRPVPDRPALRVTSLGARDLPSVTWNLPDGGGSYRLAIQGSDLVLAQSAGPELYRTPAAGATVTVHGSMAAEAIDVDLGAASDASAGLDVTLDAGGAGDSVRLACGPGENVIEAGPRRLVAAQDGSYRFEADGFDQTAATASAGFGRAHLVGSDATDWATVNGEGAHFRSVAPGWDVQVSGFPTIDLDGGPAGGYHVVELADSAGSDELTFGPNAGVLTRADGLTFSFTGFNVISFTGNSGRRLDHDVVRLSAGPGMQTFRAVGGTAKYLDGENRFELRLHHPEEVYLDGSGGGYNILTDRRAGFRVHSTRFRHFESLRFGYRLTRAQALVWIKRVALQMDPTLGQAQTPTDLAIQLRDFVHHRVRQGANSAGWPQYDAYERFLQAVVSRQESVECQGASWLYRDLLQAFGLEARQVALFPKTGRPNHASVEVRLDGQWVAMDPTFNVSFADANGVRLSYAKMRRLGQWTAQADGMTARHGWEINLGDPYTRYMYREKHWRANTVVPYAVYLFRLKYPPLWR